MSVPTYSVVIPWANRPELGDTLVRNRPIFERHAAETVIVNAGGDHNVLLDLVSRAAVPNVTTVDLSAAAFNRALCCNIGALVCRGTHLFLLDADIVVVSDILAEAAALIQNGGRFVAVSKIVEAEPPVRRPGAGPDMSCIAEMIEERTLITTDGRRAVLRKRKVGASRVGDGLVLVRKPDLMNVGGLNSSLTGWGYEDTDFQLRLQFLLGLERVDAGEVIHLTHPLTQRSLESWNRNMAQCFSNYAGGHYLGTLEQDALAWGYAVAT